MRRWLLGAAVVLLVSVSSYLAGLLPERSRRTELEAKSASLQGRLADAEALGRVGALYARLQQLADAVAGQNYGQAAELSSVLFDAVRAEAEVTHLPEHKTALASALSVRDEVTSALARGDPAASAHLRVASEHLRAVLLGPAPATAP